MKIESAASHSGKRLFQHNPPKAVIADRPLTAASSLVRLASGLQPVGGMSHDWERHGAPPAAFSTLATGQTPSRSERLSVRIIHSL